MVRKGHGMIAGLAVAALMLAACGSDNTYQAAPRPDRDPAAPAATGIFTPGGTGANLFTGDASKGGAEGAIAVNAFLWRAALDTIAFMPLASADPFGGVIITDWYAAPEAPGERFKATVYILDTRLRADGLNVEVFKQVAVGGVWSDASPSPQTETDLENAILTRARQLRLANINQ